MNKEDIFLLLNHVSTPTGYTLCGDITLDDSSCEEIIDYIEEKEEENTNYKQALNKIREYINNHKRSLVHPITHEEYEELDDENINNILQIIDEVLGDNE